MLEIVQVSDLKNLCKYHRISGFPASWYSEGFVAYQSPTQAREKSNIARRGKFAIRRINPG